MQWIHLIGRWWQQPGRERRLLLAALFWLTVMRLAILVVPFKRLLRWLGLREGRCSTSQCTFEAGQIGWAIGLVTPRTPWQSTCLAQALAAALMLRRRGIPSTLYLGVARDTAGQLLAHAWLRCGAVTLTGSFEGQIYSTIASFAP
jgi:Transglutaminase-like superfamily